MGISLSSGLPPALQPVVALARRAHQLRALPQVPLDPHLGLLHAQHVAAESSVALLLLILEPWLDPPQPDRMISITDQLAVALRAVTNVITTETPQDVGAPLLSNHIQRLCLLSAPVAVVAVQATLLVVLSALADGAMQVVVSLPRSQESQVILEIQTDAAGIAGTTYGADHDRLKHWLMAIGSNVMVRQRPRWWWTTQIYIPVGAVTDSGASRSLDATN